MRFAFRVGSGAAIDRTTFFLGGGGGCREETRVALERWVAIRKNSTNSEHLRVIHFTCCLSLLFTYR